MERSPSSSMPPPPRAPSRRQVVRAHSDSYHPVYSSSSPPVGASTSRRVVSHDLPRAHRRHAPSSLDLPPPAVSAPAGAPELGNAKVVLPRTLRRPRPQPISPAALAAVDKELENVPISYILQTLKEIGPRMMAALTRTRAPAPTSLPRDLGVSLAPDPEGDSPIDTTPTHMLAVYARSNVDAGTPPDEGVAPPRRKVTLFPTHAIVLAAHCAHLPPLPPGGSRTRAVRGEDGSNRPMNESDEGQSPVVVADIENRPSHAETEMSGGESRQPGSDSHQQRHPEEHTSQDIDRAPLTPESNVEYYQRETEDLPSSSSAPSASDERPSAEKTLTLPVVPLCIPAPKMFPVLQAYFYTKRADHLLSALIPDPCPTTPPTRPVRTPSPTPPPLDHSPTSPPGSEESESTPRRGRSPASSTPTPTPTLFPGIVPDAAALSTQLATAHSVPTLLHSALRTHGLWANAAALGVFDERLWLTIEFAWRVLLRGLERCVKVDPPPSSSSDFGGFGGGARDIPLGRDGSRCEQVDDPLDAEQSQLGAETMEQKAFTSAE